MEAAKEIDTLLTYLALSDRTDWTVPDLWFFDGAMLGWRTQMTMVEEVCGGGVSDDLANELKNIRGSCFLSADYNTEGFEHEVVGGRELSIVEKQKIIPSLNRALPAPVLTPFGSRIIGLRSVQFHPDGRTRAGLRSHYIQYKNGWGVFNDTTRPGLKNSHGEEIGLGMVAFQMALSATVMARTHWRAAFRFTPQFPSVALWTDPTGVRELLKTRDVRPGRSRRDALVHWVSQHWRQNRFDPDVEVWVREHMRGMKHCTWQGMDVEVQIPVLDEQRKQAAIVKRQRMSPDQLRRAIKKRRF